MVMLFIQPPRLHFKVLRTPKVKNRSYAPSEYKLPQNKV